MHSRDLLATGSWVGIALGLWIIAWIIAEAIPVFNDLLSLIVRCPPLSLKYHTDRVSGVPFRQLVYM